MPQRMPRQEGGRRAYAMGADKAIELAIEKECARYDITKSMVIRNALAFTFNIDLYAYESKPKIRRVK
jgi:electron transfer flavoprotein alpha/beta subunit